MDSNSINDRCQKKFFEKVFRPPESAAKVSVKLSSSLSVRCLKHSSSKSDVLLDADSTDFLYILSQVGGIVSSLVCETVKNVSLYTTWYCGDIYTVTGLRMSATDTSCIGEWPR